MARVIDAIRQLARQLVERWRTDPASAASRATKSWHTTGDADDTDAKLRVRDRY
jgi:hypothetical protein